MHGWVTGRKRGKEEGRKERKERSMDVEGKHSMDFHERKNAATVFLTEKIQHIVQSLGR